MAQSLAKIYIHAIFSTHHRQPIIADEWREQLFQIMGGIANNINCQSLIVGGMPDHVHILFQLGRTTSIADAIRGLKSNSSAWVNQHQQLNSEFHWQAGYGAFSVGQTKVEIVRRYIQRQVEHHRKFTFQEELRSWLREYGIQWDERYVWD